MVSLDLSAAFDCVDHKLLLDRLSSSFAISGSALSWLTSYVTNCSQVVQIGKACSNSVITVSCSTGVPQGSVLGACTFFNLYFPNRANGFISQHLFATVCKKSFFHLRALRPIRSALTDDMAVLIAIAVALIQCRWTELCYGLTARNLAKLQHNVIQNVAAHIVA